MNRKAIPITERSTSLLQKRIAARRLPVNDLRKKELDWLMGIYNLPQEELNNLWKECPIGIQRGSVFNSEKGRKRHVMIDHQDLCGSNRAIHRGIRSFNKNDWSDREICLRCVDSPRIKGLYDIMAGKFTPLTSIFNRKQKDIKIVPRYKYIASWVNEFGELSVKAIHSMTESELLSLDPIQVYQPGEPRTLEGIFLRLACGKRFYPGYPCDMLYLRLRLAHNKYINHERWRYVRSEIPFDMTVKSYDSHIASMYLLQNGLFFEWGEMTDEEIIKAVSCSNV